MSDPKPGFIAQIRSFPATFYVANTMEIFERMAWYGFFAVSSLYITGPKETGGLGFTSEARGQLQAIVPFILYLLPVVTGALADRYGYKKMFIIAYTGMVAAYYALGQFKTFPTFLVAFLAVALFAAIFKPVVVGTVARVTNESNSALGFGIFYMMVNIGGFFGPMVAGAVRGISWKYVFISCSMWAAVNLLIVLIFYRDPSTESTSGKKRSLGQVARDMVEVLGNVRFGLCVFVVLISLMVANQGPAWFSWWHCLIFVPVWLAANFIWDAIMPAGSGDPNHPASKDRPFYLKRMHCSNWRFAVYLLIMSGFWTSFNQIFLTTPEYVRDFTETKSMVEMARSASPSLSGLARSVVGGLGFKKQAEKITDDALLDAIAAVEKTEIMREFDGLVRRARNVGSMVPTEIPTAASNKAAKEKAIAKLDGIIEKSSTTAENRKAAVSAKDAITKVASTTPTQPSTTSAASTQPKDNDIAARKTADAAAGALFSAVGDPLHEPAEKVQDLVRHAESLRDDYRDRALIDKADAVAEKIHRAEQTEKLKSDPSLTPEALKDLERAVASINVAGAAKPLEVIDLVEGARTILQYKVRIQAGELAQLIQAVPGRGGMVEDKTLDLAVKAVNDRLDQRGKPVFSDDSAAALRSQINELIQQHGPVVPPDAVRTACEALSTSAHTLEPEFLALGIREAAYHPIVWERIDAGRQVNPEHIVNFDALAIVLLQVLISYMMGKFHQFTTMIVGMVIAAIGIGAACIAGGTQIGPIGGSLLIVVAGIVIFAIGEMMASPTSQEYVGRIAPKDRVAVYMGYYFIAVAMGNLFGGILSGQLYGKLARDMQRPDLMWLAFGGIMLATAITFLLYNRFALPRDGSGMKATA